MAVPPGVTDGDGAAQAERTRAKGRRGRGIQGWRARLLHTGFLPPTILLVVIVGIAAVPLTAANTQASALKLFAVIVLSFLPGWLFLRFVVVRARSVLDEYVLNLHRLGMDRPENLPEPPVSSIYHAVWTKAVADQEELERKLEKVVGAPAARPRFRSNLYIDKFEAYYGKSVGQTSERSKLRAETFFPVVLATAIFAVGWAVVLRDPTALAALPRKLSTLDMLRVSFAGAYLFTLQMLVRRYFQADLKASAYVNAVVRIVSALVLITIVHQSIVGDLPAGQQVAVAFVIGFFPLVGLQALQKVAAVALRTVVPSLKNDYPLSDLDGLSVWYEARLLELGIEDLENLATANLVDVLLHSRVPVGRLVDWLDQAHLYLYLEACGKSREERTKSSRYRLRLLGIRTATGLEAAFRPISPPSADGSEPGLFSAEDDKALREELRWAINDVKGEGPSVAQTLLKTLQTAPNLDHVRHWKKDWDIDGSSHDLAGGPQGPQVPRAVAA